MAVRNQPLVCPDHSVTVLGCFLRRVFRPLQTGIAPKWNKTLRISVWNFGSTASAQPAPMEPALKNFSSIRSFPINHFCPLAARRFDGAEKVIKSRATNVPGNNSVGEPDNAMWIARHARPRRGIVLLQSRNRGETNIHFVPVGARAFPILRLAKSFAWREIHLVRLIEKKMFRQLRDVGPEHFQIQNARPAERFKADQFPTRITTLAQQTAAFAVLLVPTFAAVHRLHLVAGRIDFTTFDNAATAV